MPYKLFFIIQFLFVQHLVGQFSSRDLQQRPLLQDFCTSGQQEYKALLLVVSMADNQPSNIQKHLAKECNFTPFHGISLLNLSAIISQKLPKSTTQNLYIIFDFTTISSASEFNSLIRQLNQFASQCSQCRQLLLLFNQSAKTLHKWMIDQMPSTSNTFQCILKSIKDSTSSYSTLHVRPVIDGCHQLQSVYWPQNTPELNRLFVPYTQCNLTNVKLNVIANNFQPYCEFTIQPNGSVTTAKVSIELEMIKILAERYHFKINLHLGDGHWGFEMKNGSWDGMVKDILDGREHLAICIITASIQRLQVVDFTNYVFVNERSLLVQAVHKRSTPYALLTPFNRIIWALIGLAFIVIYCILVALSQRPTFCVIGSMSTLLATFGILVNRALNRFWKQKQTAIRIILTAWLLSVAILTTLYCSDLHSILLALEFERPIENLADFERAIQADDFTLLTKEVSDLWRQIVKLNQTPNEGLYYTMKQHFSRLKRKMMDSETWPSEILTMQRRGERNIYIDNKLSLLVFSGLQQHLGFYVVPEAVEVEYISIMLKKQSPLKRPFDLIIMRCHQNGLINNWIEKLLRQINRISKPTTATSATSNLNRNFTIQDFRSIFILWLCGLVIATVAVIVELIKYFK